MYQSTSRLKNQTICFYTYTVVAIGNSAGARGEGELGSHSIEHSATRLSL